MQWFYFVKTKKVVALWSAHYPTLAEADDAFYDAIRLFYPIPAIVYDRSFEFSGTPARTPSAK
jgi:hypothetical protein